MVVTNSQRRISVSIFFTVKLWRSFLAATERFTWEGGEAAFGLEVLLSAATTRRCKPPSRGRKLLDAASIPAGTVDVVPEGESEGDPSF